MSTVSVNRETLQKLLDYVAPEELRHYEESEEPEGHVYELILELQKELTC